jgi:hypothetical protein
MADVRRHVDFTIPNPDPPVRAQHRPSLVVPALLALSVLLIACAKGEAGSDRAAGDSAGASAPAAASPAARDSAGGAIAQPAPARGAPGEVAASPGAAGGTGAANRAAAPIDVDKEFPVVRALYVNRWKAQSSKEMRRMIQYADDTEINALVIDLKDEFGLNYTPGNAEWRKNAGTAGTIRNLPALLDTLRAHRILPIARLVVFKDSVAARMNPGHTIMREDGSVWRDKKGLPWVNPYDRKIWDYNIGVAVELAGMGFSEIQFDYIRFPEPYASLPKQVFPGNNVRKPDALAAFLKEANERLDKVGARTTADIFGLVTTVQGPLEIGQHWEKLAPVTDVLLPMVYPSHYPPGSFGLKRPNAQPYETIKIAITEAKKRNDKLGIRKVEAVRPWLQAFTLGAPAYGANEIREQKRAVYDSGYDGWVLWAPGSRYEPFMPAMEKTLVSRKKGT